MYNLPAQYKNLEKRYYSFISCVTNYLLIGAEDDSHNREQPVLLSTAADSSTAPSIFIPTERGCLSRNILGSVLTSRL